MTLWVFLEKKNSSEEAIACLSIKETSMLNSSATLHNRWRVCGPSFRVFPVVTFPGTAHQETRAATATNPHLSSVRHSFWNSGLPPPLTLSALCGSPWEHTPDTVFISVTKAKTWKSPEETQPIIFSNSLILQSRKFEHEKAQDFSQAIGGGMVTPRPETTSSETQCRHPPALRPGLLLSLLTLPIPVVCRIT